MDGRFSSYILIVLLIVATHSPLVAEHKNDDALLRSLYNKQTSAHPLQDDASLNDLQFLGQKTGWAVGDHGTVWKTSTGGETWELVPIPTTARLNSVCFITDGIGWIAGGQYVPFSGHSRAVLFYTNDGGKSWEERPVADFPEITRIQMFDLKSGVAIGLSSPRCPSGLLKTIDGGKTWEAIPGTANSVWEAAHFFDADTGFVAGQSGQRASVGGGRLLTSLNRSFTLKSFADVALLRDGTGCLVGDGGTLLVSDNGGVSWKAPAFPFPQELRTTTDFHAVSKFQSHIWVAGQPGSIIWHSPDNGVSWERQFTGSTTPISAVDFVDANTGWAAGAFGTILKTNDGGRSWRTVRGPKRQLAVLCFPAQLESTPLQLLAEYSLEEGYRSGVCLLTSHASGQTTNRSLFESERQLRDITLPLGSNTSHIDWPLPLDLPDIHLKHEQLVDYWNRRTDGKLAATVIGRLVLQIRTMKPHVVMIDRSAETPLHRLLAEAVKTAVRHASDATRFREHQTLYGLSPWQVPRIASLQPAGHFSPLSTNPHRLLTHVGTTTENTIADSRSLLQTEADVPLTPARAERYTWEPIQTDAPTPNGSMKHLFIGLGISPGSSARRPPTPVDTTNLEARQRLARHQRNFREYTSRFLNDPIHAAQLPSQLKDILSTASDREAALQMSMLARTYRENSQFDLAAEIYAELIHRYEREPVALEALVWMIQYHSSREIVWQRLREQDGGRRFVENNQQALENEIQQVLNQTTQNDQNAGNRVVHSGGNSAGVVQVSADVTRQQARRLQLRKEWNKTAVTYVKKLKELSKDTFSQPHVQFPVASLMRQQGTFRLADGVYRGFSPARKSGWNLAAQSELWMLSPQGLPPKSLILVRRAPTPPILDAVIADDCWQLAAEVNLGFDEQDTQQELEEDRHDSGLCLFSYDQRYLYIAASIPKRDDVEYASVQKTGREYDAPLAGFDRLDFIFDVDRDYTSYYRLSVDQRGQTQDACWEDMHWNPKWYVAAEDDETHWRVELAIPWNELASRAPGRGDVWAGGVTRIIPAVGLQSWTHPATQRPQPDSFGLLKFE